MAWAYGALPWLSAVALLALVVVAVCYWPLRFDVTGRARGEADGNWLVGGGVSLAGLSVAFVSARGIGLQLTFLFFGRKLTWKPDWTRRLARPVPKRVKAASRKAWSRVEPLGLLLKLLEERRHLRLRYFVVELAYGFRDPLLTGRLAGALSVLSAVLPPPIELRQAPRWDFEDGWSVSVDGRAIVKPWLMLLDLAAYVVRQMASRKAPEAQRLAAEGPSQLR
jgi:hypothetical protein